MAEQSYPTEEDSAIATPVEDQPELDQSTQDWLLQPAPEGTGNLDQFVSTGPELAQEDALASLAPKPPNEIPTPNLGNAEDFASQVAKIRSEYSGTDFHQERVNVLEELKTQPIQFIRDNATRLATALNIQDMKGVFDSSLKEGNVDVASLAVQRHRELTQAAELGVIPPMVMERGVVNMTSNMPTNYTGLSKEDRAAQDMYSTNFVHQRIAELEGKNKWADMVAYFVRSLPTSFFSNDARVLAKSAEEVLGKQYSFWDKNMNPSQAMQDVAEVLATSTPEASTTLITNMMAAIKKNSGLWGTEGNEISELVNLNMLLNVASKQGATQETIFSALQTFTPPVFSGIYMSFAKGAALMAQKGVVATIASINPEGAARMVSGTLQTGVPTSTKMGVTDAVSLSSSLKPTGSLGEDINRIAPHIGKELEKSTIEFERAIAEKTAPSTLTDAQRLEDATKTASTLPTKDDSILAVEVGSLKQDRFEATVTRVDPATKKPFSSIEEAEAFAKREGHTNYRIVEQAADVERAADLDRRIVAKTSIADVFESVMETRRWGIPALTKEIGILSKGGYPEQALAEELKQLTTAFTELYGSKLPQEAKFAQLKLVSDKITSELAALNKPIPKDMAVGSRAEVAAERLTTAERALFQIDKTLKNGSTIRTISKNVESVGNALDKEFSGIASEITKLFGMEQRIVLTAFEDLPEVFTKYPNLFHENVRKTFGSNISASGLAVGMRQGLIKDSKGLTIIGLKTTGKTYFEKVHTLLHELAHGFEYEFLQNTSKAQRESLTNAFTKWAATKDSNYALHMGFRNQAELVESVNGVFRIRDASGFNFLTKDEMKWYADFSEWFAENTTKYLTTKPIGQDIVGQFFYALAQKLKATAEFVMKSLGKDIADPNEAVARFLDEHIAAIRGGKVLPYMTRDRANFGESFFAKLSQTIDSHAASVEKEIVMKDKGYVIEQLIEEPYMYTGVGIHTAEAISQSGGLLTAGIPKLNITAYTYENAVASLHSNAKERSALVRWFKEGTKGLSAKEQQGVATLLEQIDSLSNKGNSLENLSIGVDYLRAAGMNDGQIRMYSRVREIRDWMWAKHNDVMKAELKRGGYGSRVTFEDANLGKVDMAAEVYTNQSTIKSLISTGSIKTLYDMRTGAGTTLSTTDVDKLYATGNRIVRLRYPQGGFTHLILNDKVQLRGLGDVLPYRPHEYSRIYSDKYFITMKGNEIVDGVAQEYNKVFRTAASSREAEQYVKALQTSINAMKLLDTGKLGYEEAQTVIQGSIGKFGKSVEDFTKAVRSGEIPLDVEYSYRFDRTKEDALTSLVDEHINNGRMFESQRKAKLMSVYEDRVNTKSVMDSLGTELSMIGQMANLSEWRTSSIAKWVNTFVPEGARTGNMLADLQRAPIKYEIGSKEYNSAVHERNYIIATIQTRSQGEKLMAARARKVGEWMENREGVVGKAAEYALTGMQLRNSNPLTFLRTVNFSLNLGMFNPSQLLVQSLGMMNAVFVHPVHGAKAALTAIPLRMALMSDNPEVWAKLAAITGHDGKDFAQLVQGVRKSGIMDSIKSSSLYNNADGFDNIFKEYGGSLNKAQSVFFDRGEEFSRLVSWDVARREWMAANPGKDFLNPDVINQLTAKMDDYTLGMTKANLANWQRGLTSIPTQFLQYNIKLASELLASASGQSKVFTRKQAASIVFGNLVFWGTAGNGLRGISDELFGDDTTLSDEAKLALTQGAVAALINGISDAKVATGSRFGTFNWYSDMYNSIISGNETIPDIMLGVTKNNLSKIVDVAADLHNLWHGGPLDGKALEEAVLSVATLASGMNNATKMYLLTNNGGRLYNKKGELLTTIDQKEAIYQLFGIKSAELDDYYHSQRVLSEDSVEMKELSLEIKQQQHRAHEALVLGDMESYTRHLNVIRFLYTQDPLKEDRLIKATKERYQRDTGSEALAKKLAARNLSVVGTGE